eukprot:CAMPEP_0172616298 /NCGR_PEP_ID=MMETSP1068-20121228/63549_1 /TAXON_ID=35684 /ORGANISM="Pseudopedinella elastica, Strain CCMP716" /LENGTH=320 /DNA_ID=CAMNT_0013421685 /DNA_START=67 /DNA_END=1029 /DNA_ORIENTATION=+
MLGGSTDGVSFDWVRRLDATTRGGRTIEGVVTKTTLGAVLTLLSSSLILLLVLTELGVYTAVSTAHHLAVDSGASTHGGTSVTIKLHATFFHLACDAIALDMEATKGDPSQDTSSEVAKTPYPGTQGPAEGCTLRGELTVAKVGGNFHLAVGGPTLSPGGGAIHLSGGLFGALGGMAKGANLSHTVHHLSFGPDFTGLANPLDGVTNLVPTDVGQYQFNIKVIPTVYRPLGIRRTVFSNQFSVSEQFVRLDLMTALQQPSASGIYFYYDFYPVMVEYHEEKPSFLQFLTRVCGIIGGVFTVAGVIDRILHGAQEQMKKQH